jgi:glutaredoxin 3
MVRMLDVKTMPEALAMEVDRPASRPPRMWDAPPSGGPQLHQVDIQRYRRCHRHGLMLDMFGNCEQCDHLKAETAQRDERNMKLGLVVALVALVGCVLGGWWWSGRQERAAKVAAAQIAAVNENKLVVYTMQSCGACRIARAHLQRKGIPFVERAIDQDPSAFVELERVNPSRSVPTFVIGSEVMVGIDPAGLLLDQALAKHGMLPAAGTVPPAAPKE